jgi:hypothetical protein
MRYASYYIINTPPGMSAYRGRVVKSNITRYAPDKQALLTSSKFGLKMKLMTFETLEKILLTFPRDSVARQHDWPRVAIFGVVGEDVFMADFMMLKSCNDGKGARDSIMHRRGDVIGVCLPTLEYRIVFRYNLQ